VLALPAALVVFDVLAVTVVPVFGTAQSFSRCLVEWPSTLALAALGGFALLTFTLAVPQAAFVVAWRHRRDRGTAAAALVVGLVVSVCVAGAVAWRTVDEPVASVRVAAVGWTYEQLGNPWSGSQRVARLERVLAPFVAEAAADGAALVVAPEAAFAVQAGDRDAFLDAAGRIAQDHGVTLVVGWFDQGSDTNHATVFDSQGRQRADYLKTHLIPGMEGYTAGDGILIAVHLREGLSLGAMICQDDNFRDLGRRYGRMGVPLVAVPTNDWEQVQEFHLQNSRLRAADSGYGIVRGATNGISAIVDARGRMLAELDHHAHGPGVIVADLPLYDGGTTYARRGEWFALACLGGLILCVVEVRRRRSAASRP